MIGLAPIDLVTLKLRRETPLYDDRDLNYTWSLAGVDEKRMDFDINFTATHEVSVKMSGPDRMLIWFSLHPIRQSLLFNNRTLATTPEMIDLPKLMQPSFATTAVAVVSESLTGGFTGMFWIGIVLQFLGSEALTIMMLMVRTYQFILHLPIFQFNMTANVIGMYRTILPIVCWDMMDYAFSWE